MCSIRSPLKSEDPLKRGSARTTAKLPRGTFGLVPKGLEFGNYVLPQYVKDEPIGSHARTTPQLPRGTVAPMPASVRDSGNPWDENTLESNGLGSLGNAAFSEAREGGDPIKEYGQKAAGIVLGELQKLAPSERSIMFNKVLNEVDPKLRSIAAREIAKRKRQGMDDASATQAGLAEAFSAGLVGEFIRLGRTKKVAPKSQVALAAKFSQHDNFERAGLSGVTSWLSGVVDKLGSAACTVASNKATPFVAGAAGAYTGGPAGASLAVTGTGVAAAACAPDPEPASFIPSFSSGPSWALPAIIGGGALALFLVLKK